MHRKKILTIFTAGFLAVSICAGLAGCGKSGQDTNPQTTASTSAERESDGSSAKEQPSISYNTDTKRNQTTNKQSTRAASKSDSSETSGTTTDSSVKKNTSSKKKQPVIRKNTSSKKQVTVNGKKVTVQEDKTNTSKPSAKASKHAYGSVEQVYFVRAVDGDTIVVRSEHGDQTVRLIGVNAPKVQKVYYDDTTKAGKTAAEFVGNYFMEKQDLWLEYDESDADQKGHTLAYVWLKNPATKESYTSFKKNCFNAIVLQNTFSKMETYKPNQKYQKYFDKLAKE